MPDDVKPWKDGVAPLDPRLRALCADGGPPIGSVGRLFFRGRMTELAEIVRAGGPEITQPLAEFTRTCTLRRHPTSS